MGGKTNGPLVKPKNGLIVPVGGVAPVAEVSLTYAVQVVGWLATIVVGVHVTTDMMVGCRFATVTTSAPELTAWAESPL